MPIYTVTEDSTGRSIDFDGESPPDQSTVDQAFRNYDAFKIAQAGPRGSRERRVASAQVTAQNSQDAFAKESGGSTSSPFTSAIASLGAGASEGGSKIIKSIGRFASYLPESMGAGIADSPVPADQMTAAAILERSDNNPLVQAGQSLEDQGKATYPVNPKYPWANLPGSAIASGLSVVAAGPLAVPAYAAQSFESGLQDSRDAGATPEQAIQQGAVEALTGAATEASLGLVPFLHEAAKGVTRGFLKPTAKAIVGEAIQEPTEGILNRLSAKYLTQTQPGIDPFDPQTIAMEAAGGAIGAGAISGGFTGANQYQRGQRLAQIRQYRADPLAQLANQVENGPMGSSPQYQLEQQLRQMPRAEAPRGILNLQPNFPIAGPSQDETASGIGQIQDQSVQTPFDQLRNRAIRAQRRANVEQGLTMEQPSQPVEQPVQQVGQYPAEGFGTGAIVSPEEQARRDAVRARVEQANAQQAEQARAEALRQQNLQAQALVVAARQAEAERQAEVLARYERMKARPISTPFLDAQLPQPVQAPLVQTDQGLTEVVQPEGQTPMDDLIARLRAVRAQTPATASGGFTPGGALQAVGGITADFGGLKMSVIPSPDDPSIGFVTGLSGSGVAGKLNEIKAALNNAGFRDIQYRPDNEDGRSAARVRLFESLKAKIASQSITPSNENQVPQAGSLPNVKGQPSQTSAEVQATPGTAQQKGANPEVAEPVYPVGFKPFIDENGIVVERWRPSRFDLNNPPAGVDVGIADFYSRGGGSYMWRAVGDGELVKLLSRSKTYGGGVSGRGNYLAAYPEKAAKWDPEQQSKYLIEFAGAKPSGETSKNKLTLDNVTRILVRENGQWRALTDQERQELVYQKPPTPSGVRLRKEPISRSNPAAAQRLATLGQAAPSSEGAASSAFGVRSYGGTTITREQVASHNQEVEKRAAAGDPTAIRVQKLIASVDTDQGVGRFAGYATLPDSGKNKALAYYSTSLYRQIGKWLDGGEFKFQPLAVSRSATSSSGKTQAVQMEAKTVGETPLGEDTAETNLTRSSEPIVQQVPLAKPVKLQEESVKTILDLQRELGVSSESLVRIIHAFQDQNTSDLDDQELAALEAATPTLNKLRNVQYSVAGEAAPFYSRLVRTVEQSQQGKATGAQWKALIKNSKLGTNSDEFALVGVNDLEDGKTYTKAEVLEYLNANQVAVKDVTLGEGLSGDAQKRFEEIQLRYRILTDEMAGNRFQRENREITLEESRRNASRLSAERSNLDDEMNAINRQRSETHFSSYQLPGGKEGSYREVLLTVPGSNTSGKSGAELEDWKRQAAIKYGPNWNRQDLTWFERQKLDEFTIPTSWVDGHSQYSSITNPIVRLRFNERTTADGKRMLFLEEVQAPQKAQFEKMPALFQKNWREIAFKWALRHAADNGFDSVGWTTGEQQAERYDLSQQVKRIEWNSVRERPGQVLLTVFNTNDSRVMNEWMPVEKVESVVGKEIAAKILNEPNGTLQGDGLKIGGEGLKKLYDSDFRNVVNGLPAVKKSGQKVGMAEINKPGGIGQWRYEGPLLLPEEVRAIARKQDVRVEQQLNDIANSVLNGTDLHDAVEQLGSASAARALGGTLVPVDKTLPIHAIAITPAIRDSVMGGQALFSVGSSLSTLIREPLGLERTQEAVNQWKAVHGGQDIAIRVVDDPNLKTPDGRTVAAQVEMVPGGVPIITINASQVGSAAEVHEKIWHELFHPVWNDPSVQQAWGEVMQSVDQRMVEGQLARGYSPEEAAMEAAIDLAAMKAGDKKVRSAWKRFLDKVWNAMKKAFGFEVRPNNFEALMISALRQASRPWNGQQQNQYNQDVAALDKAHLEAVARGDMATAQRLVDEAAKRAGYSTAKPGNNASKRNSLRVKLSRQALTDLALSQANWRDWYKEHQDTLNAFFGSDAGLFQKILAITSQAASVKANVGLALKAFAQFKQGLAFDGYLPAVIGNLNALRAETQIQGRKIGAYTSANEGQTDAVVVDRHIARMLFGVDTPSAAQFAKAARVLTEIANEIGWEPRQVQAALWAASIVKSGKQPQSYGQYLKQLNSNGTLAERIGHVVDRSSEIYGIGGSGVADSGGISTETEGSKSADPVTYDDAGKVVLLSQRFNPQNKDIRYSVANNLYVTSPTKFNTIAANGQTEAVAAQGQVSSAIVPESTLKVVSDLEAKQDRNPVENATLKALKGVSNIAQVAAAADQLRANVDGMPSYTTINQLPEEFKSVGAQSVMATHFYLNQFRKSIRTQMERASNDVATLSQELADLTPDRLLATLTSHEADEMLVNLQKFLDVEQGKLGTSTASRTREELDKASAAIVGMRRKIEAISAGLQAMAKEMPLADFDSPAAVKAWLESRMADKNLPLLMGQDVFQTIRVALNKDSTLHNRLSMVRGLMADTQAAKKELEGLAKQLGSGKPAVVLKRIIEMKGDARAVLDNVRRLDLRLDRAMNKIEGLTEAGNVMDQMQVDPSYQERVKSAFDYAGFKYSGVIRFDDQPSGNQTLRAPDGTEYRINFSPDFAVERQNLDTLGKWMEKTLDALTNPESPQYITDPATRTSYANTMAFVSRFLMDKRGLVESAWADAGSVQTMNAILGAPEKLVQLKFLLGDHLNTRFNLYRNLAGRAGLDLVNRSRAIDRFMAEVKNILDATRTQNAAARRKAILSHGLNPDDPADYELWNSTVNSWILSQNQNPGSRPVQEGVHVGMGLEVTKEDIAFAGLQHKFSRAISEAYSGIIGEDMVQDPNAPGYNPEETLFGQVFSRKAMQFGFATGRKFSHAGREYTKLWMDARSKDLAEYKASVAAAPEGTEVPMVYTERKKVAEESMEGHVYAHIRESNPEYTSTADKGLREAYRDVANAIRSGADFRSITDLSMALAEAMTTDEKDVGAFEAEQSLMKALDRDVVNYNMAAEVVGSTSPNETVTDLPPALRSIKTAKGALVKARGKMVAPSFFYDYSIGTDLDRSSMVQMGKQALMISEVNAARNMVAAMRDKLDGHERQIDKNAKVIGRNGKPVGRGRAIAELDAELKKKFREGAEFITYKMLKKHIAALETAIGDREKSMVRERVTEEESFKVSMVNALGGGVISSILSAPAPMINNMLAVVTDPVRIGMMVGGPLTAINWAGRGAMSALKYSFQKLVNGVVDATGVVLSRDAKAKLAEMASFITGSMLDTRSNLERSGTIDAPESFTSIWSRYKNNPAAFGRATRARETEFSKNFSRVMTSPLFAYGFLPAMGEWLKQKAPGSGDRMVNYVNAKMGTLMANRYAPYLWNWVNEQDGTTVEEKIRSAMEAGALRGSDLGVSDEAMANIRDILGPAGSLEKLALDYYRANPNGAKGPLLNQSQREGVEFEIAAITNKETDSTRPDITKGGAGMENTFRRMLYLFARYILQHMGVNKRVFGIKGGDGGGLGKDLKKGLGYLFVLAMTLLAGSLALPIKQLARTLLQREPLTSPTIVQAFDSPEMAGKYLASAAMGVLPVGAAAVGMALTGNGVNGPITANFFDSNPIAGAANNLIQAATSAYQTKDITYPALDLARKTFWFSQPLINAAMPGDTMAREANRAVRTAATGLEIRPQSGGGMGRSTPVTPFVRDAVAATYEGNAEAFAAAKQKAIDYYVSQGKTAKEAEARFNSSVSGRDPFRSVFGRTPTADETATVQRRLTSGQAETLSKANFSRPARLRKTKGSVSLRKRRKSKGYTGLRKPSSRRVRLRRVAYS
jgi:hypothetical protein